MPKCTVRGVSHHYQRLGQDDRQPPVVFIHGLVMDNLSSWYLTVATAVAQSTSVLLYDLRGHGLSERPTTGYSLEDFVADLCALLDVTLGAMPVRLVSNSFGGAIAIELARRHPERVAGLVLVDGHLGATDFQDKMVATLALRERDSERVAQELLRDWHGRDSPRKRASIAVNAHALLNRTTLIADLRKKPPLAAHDFAAIHVPTLALYGEHSDALAPSRPLLAQMPHCRLEVLAGCAHVLLWQATDLVRSHVLDFCRAPAEVAV